MRLVLLLVVLPLAARAEDRCLSVEQVNVQHGIDLVVTMNQCSEVTLTVTAETENVKWLLPATADSAGRKKFVLQQFRRDDASQAWRVRDWKYRYKFGRRLDDVPPPYHYAKPFEGTRKLLQGPHGSFSHQDGSQNEEAYDWRMPEGTEVLAARDGVVVGWRDDSDVGGADESYKYDCNYVILRHDDGTFAEYDHLQQGGVRVKLGQKVKTGDVLALSGNTGFSSEPHLHFDAFYAVDGNTRVTLPLTFGGALETHEATHDEDELRVAKKRKRGRRESANDAFHP